MSEWTKRDQARVAFLDAAVAHHRWIDSLALRQPDNAPIPLPDHATFDALEKAWTTYRDLIDGKEENLPLNEKRWFCPYCGAERPSYTVQLVGELVIGIGAIQYINFVCGNESCKKLLGIIGVGFAPEAEMVAAAKAQIAGHKGGHA